MPDIPLVRLETPRALPPGCFDTRPAFFESSLDGRFHIRVMGSQDDDVVRAGPGLINEFQRDEDIDAFFAGAVSTP
jgi:hypothetical protein